MSNFTTIYIVRHGESVGNSYYNKGLGMDVAAEGEQGTPLTETGEEQVKKLTRELEDVKLDAIYSSELLRAQQTAKFIADSKNMEVVTAQNIHERKFGAFAAEGKWTKEMRREAESALEDLNDEEKLLHKYFEDGESALDAVMRFWDFIREIAPLYTGKTILVVNHGNVMRSLLVHNGIAKYDQLPSGSLDNAGYYIVETDGQDMFNVKKMVGINFKNKNDE